MKIITAILILIAIAIGLSVGLPLLAAGVSLGIGLGCLFIWLLPFLIIATSDKTTGAEKLAWLLAMIFLSWFAWVFYWLLAPLKRKNYRYDDYGYRRHRRYRDDRDDWNDRGGRYYRERGSY